MPNSHCVTKKEIGQLRIYMTPGEKRRSTSYRQKLFGKYLYREIIDAARQNGILTAVAYPTHYGYSGTGKIESIAMSEIPNKSLNLCVELISPRDDMECFVRKYSDMFKDKVLVYKHLEHWEISRHDTKTNHMEKNE